jgi:hypothetical protein
MHKAIAQGIIPPGAIESLGGWWILKGAEMPSTGDPTAEPLVNSGKSLL